MIADYFLGDEPAAEDRSTLALAWTHAFAVRATDRTDIELAPEEAEDAPPPNEAMKQLTRSRARSKAKRRLKSKAPPKRELRKLVNLDELDPGSVKVVFLEGKRAGKYKSLKQKRLVDPRKEGGGAGAGRREFAPSGDRDYTDRNREDVALALITQALAHERGLDLEDIRDEGGTGADAHDPKAEIWVELKAHGRDLPDNIRLEPSEAERAAEARGNYLLALVWNLEAPRTPRLAVIPDPIKRLDTYLGRGMRLTGIRELAERSSVSLDEK